MVAISNGNIDQLKKIVCFIVDELDLFYFLAVMKGGHADRKLIHLK